MKLIDFSMLEHQALMVHHTSPGFNRSEDRPTYRYIRLGDRPNIYISWLSSRHACWSDKLTIEDSWVDGSNIPSIDYELDA
jgi:hypothetical protein